METGVGPTGVASNALFEARIESRNGTNGKGGRTDCSGRVGVIDASLGFIVSTLPWWLAPSLIRLAVLVVGTAFDETYVNRTTVPTAAIATHIHVFVAGEVSVHADAGLAVGAESAATDSVTGAATTDAGIGGGGDGISGGPERGAARTANERGMNADGGGQQTAERRPTEPDRPTATPPHGPTRAVATTDRRSTTRARNRPPPSRPNEESSRSSCVGRDGAGSRDVSIRIVSARIVYSSASRVRELESHRATPPSRGRGVDGVERIGQRIATTCEFIIYRL